MLLNYNITQFRISYEGPPLHVGMEFPEGLIWLCPSPPIDNI